MSRAVVEEHSIYMLHMEMVQVQEDLLGIHLSGQIMAISTIFRQQAVIKRMVE